MDICMDGQVSGLILLCVGTYIQFVCRSTGGKSLIQVSKSHLRKYQKQTRLLILPTQEGFLTCYTDHGCYLGGSLTVGNTVHRAKFNHCGVTRSPWNLYKSSLLSLRYADVIRGDKGVMVVWDRNQTRQVQVDLLT